MTEATNKTKESIKELYENGNLRSAIATEGEKTVQMNGYANGKMERIAYYKQAKQHGSDTSWYENGQIRYEMNYRDNALDGEALTWYENGNPASVTSYVKGEKHGKATRWSEDGEEAFVTEYKKGVAIRQSEASELVGQFARNFASPGHAAPLSAPQPQPGR